MTHYHAATMVSNAVVCIDDEFGTRASREVEALCFSNVVPLIVPSEGNRSRNLLEIRLGANDGEGGEREVGSFFDVVDC